jgi:hypothetical protein
MPLLRDFANVGEGTRLPMLIVYRIGRCTINELCSVFLVDGQGIESSAVTPRHLSFICLTTMQWMEIATSSLLSFVS